MLIATLLLTLSAVPQDATNSGSASPDKLICRQPRGGMTHIKARPVCRTSAEWKARDAQTWRGDVRAGTGGDMGSLGSTQRVARPTIVRGAIPG